MTCKLYKKQGIKDDRVPTDCPEAIQYIPRNMHTVFVLLCFVVVIYWLIFPYPSGLLHWHCGNLAIAPVPAKQPWWIWINTSCEFIMNDCITTTKQSTTKPCPYFLGYTVGKASRLCPRFPFTLTSPCLWFENIIWISCFRHNRAMTVGMHSIHFQYDSCKHYLRKNRNNIRPWRNYFLTVVRIHQHDQRYVPSNFVDNFVEISRSVDRLFGCLFEWLIGWYPDCSYCLFDDRLFDCWMDRWMDRWIYSFINSFIY